MTPTNAYVARQARAARTRTIRRGVISGALSLFVAVWMWVALVLVSGHDPVLGAQSSSSSAALSSGSGTSGTSATSATGSQSSAATPSSVVTRTS